VRFYFFAAPLFASNSAIFSRISLSLASIAGFDFGLGPLNVIPYLSAISFQSPPVSVVNSDNSVKFVILLNVILLELN
jgi:hypothetical protein